MAKNISTSSSTGRLMTEATAALTRSRMDTSPGAVAIHRSAAQEWTQWWPQRQTGRRTGITTVTVILQIIAIPSHITLGGLGALTHRSPPGVGGGLDAS